MNLTSFLANKCFEYLLKCDAEQDTGQSCVQLLPSPPAQLSILPPWSQNSKIFKSMCNGCGDCISACENSILILNKNGYPQVDFMRGSCNFCGACAKSCHQGALRYEPLSLPWDIYAYIGAGCLVNNNVVCSTCIEHCDKEAIVIPRIIDNEKLPQVLTDSCDGCGACFKACPVHAIEIFQKVSRATLTNEESL